MRIPYFFANCLERNWAARNSDTLIWPEDSLVQFHSFLSPKIQPHPMPDASHVNSIVGFGHIGEFAVNLLLHHHSKSFWHSGLTCTQEPCSRLCAAQ